MRCSFHTCNRSSCDDIDLSLPTCMCANKHSSPLWGNKLISIPTGGIQAGTCLHNLHMVWFNNAKLANLASTLSMCVLWCVKLVKTCRKSVMSSEGKRALYKHYVWPCQMVFKHHHTTSIIIHDWSLKWQRLSLIRLQRTCVSKLNVSANSTSNELLWDLLNHWLLVFDRANFVKYKLVHWRAVTTQKLQ